MPVLVNYDRCTFKKTCFAANVCPKGTLRVDATLGKVVVDPTVCGDCPGPCLNFCDPVALKYAPDLLELDINQRELDGLLTKEAAALERTDLVKKRKEAEALAKAEAERAANAPKTLTSRNFVQEVRDATVPVLIDFWAEWCQPCKQIAPIVEQLAQEYAGRVKFAKVNIDDEPQIAGQLRIQSIPTLMIFFQGQVADMIVGAVGKEQLRSRLQRVVDAVAQLQTQQQPAAPSPAAQPAPAPQPKNAAPVRLMRGPNSAPTRRPGQ
jgi:thioredoxin 1